MALAARPGPAAELISLSEAARLAGVHPATVRSWCSRGDLPSLRHGPRKELRLRRRDVERLIEGRNRAKRERRIGRSDERRGDRPDLRVVGGTDALRRLASELSGSDSLQPVFEEVLDNSIRLFHADRAGLWLWHPEDDHPLELVASREFPAAIEQRVRAATKDSNLAGFEALRRETVIVFKDAADGSISQEMRELYAEFDIKSLCFVPAVFRGEPLALLVLYHAEPYDWSDDETALARSFGDTIATAIGNARLMASVEDLAARLRAVQDLSARLSTIQDVRGIGETIVAEARSLVPYDTVRVYRVDHDAGWCEPIAFQGTFMGRVDPEPELLRVRIGDGLTGWVAEHSEPLRIGDAHADSRSLIVGDTVGPESMLVVPMTYEGRVRGIVVASRLGRDRFGPDDETTLSIFAGAAAQALVNAERLEQLRTQQVELEHQLVSQRRLMAVNERLLSTLDPSGVLEMIADSLKTVVAYDSLTIYRIDKERGVRRPVIARDRFAELILGYDAPLGTGLTGWAVDHREPVLANDAHLDTAIGPDPGHAIRAGVDGHRPAHGRGRGARHAQHRPDGRRRVPLQPERVRAHEALRRPGGDRAPERRGPRRGQGPGRARRAHRAPEPRRLPARAGRRTSARRRTGRSAVLMMDLDRFKGYNDRNGHPAGDELLAAVSRAIESCIRQGDRAYRYGGDEFAVILPDCGRQAAEEVARRIRAAIEAIPDESGGPHVTISVGVACHPEDATDKENLVETADQALFLAKGAPFRGSRDQFVAALDETAIGLLDGSGPEALLDSILDRAARLLGRPHRLRLPRRARRHAPHRRARAIGVMAGVRRVPARRSTRASAGRSSERAGRSSSTTTTRSRARSPSYKGKVGAVVGVPLTSAGASSACSASPRARPIGCSGSPRSTRSSGSPSWPRSRSRTPDSRSRRCRRATR